MGFNSAFKGLNRTITVVGTCKYMTLVA